MAILAQGALLGAGLLATTLLLAALTWWGSWGWAPRWEEARRHASRPWILVERWIRCRWIHRDCEYWLLRVRLDRGPVRLEGQIPAGVYWSLTYYVWTEAHASISSANATVRSGRYGITLSAEEAPGDWLAVPAGTRRALLYLRVYVPDGPVPLPRVSQGGRVLVQETR